jgi:hypothetical protein
VGQPRILGNTVPVRASAIRSLSRTLLQATLTLSKFWGRECPAAYICQSSSIPQASAIAQKASEASKKTLNSSYSFLRRLPFFSRLQCGRWGCLLFLVWPFLLGYFWPSFRLLLAFFRGISGPSFRDFFSPFYGIYSAPFWQFWPFGSWIHLASFSLLFSNFYGPPPFMDFRLLLADPLFY